MSRDILYEVDDEANFRGSRRRTDSRYAGRGVSYYGSPPRFPTERSLVPRRPNISSAGRTHPPQTIRIDQDELVQPKEHIRHEVPRHGPPPMAINDNKWAFIPESPDWDPREDEGKSDYHLKLDDIKRRVLFQTEQYPQRLQIYIRPVTNNKRAMKQVVKTFERLDRNPAFLSKSSAEFIQGLQSVPDEHKDVFRIERVDDDTHSVYHSPNDGEDNGENNKNNGIGIGISGGDGGGDGDDDNGDDADNGDDDNNYDDEWGVTYDECDDFDLQEDFADSSSAAALPSLAGSEDNAGSTYAPGLMVWPGFRYHALSRNSNIVDDRRKSMIAIAKTVSVGIPTPVGTFTVQGLFGLLAAVLQKQDWQAYYQASSRILLVPEEITESRLNEFELEERERRVLGTTKYLAVGGRPMMTCLTYSDGDYGVITLFDVEMQSGGGTLTSWPVAIRPQGVLPRVPKKLLKKIIRDLPRSKKTKLCVNSRRDQMVWSTPTARAARAAKEASNLTMGPAYDPGINQTELSNMLLEALPVRTSELTGAQAANCVAATIPAMLAWLHARSAYLTNIKVECTRLLNQPRNGEETTATASTIKFATFIQGPKANEQGANPTVVVIHPDQGDWVTIPIHWA